MGREMGKEERNWAEGKRNPCDENIGTLGQPWLSPKLGSLDAPQTYSIWGGPP